MNWDDAEKLCSKWGGHFALKGIMSVEDAKKAVDIGCTGIMVSNHGGRQLDGSRSPFDQLAEIVDWLEALRSRPPHMSASTALILIHPFRICGCNTAV